MSNQPPVPLVAPMTPMQPLPPPPPLPDGVLRSAPRCADCPNCPNWRSRWVRGGRREVNHLNGARVPANRWENQSPFGDPPRPRSGHTFIVHKAADKAVLFGGLGDDTAQTGEDPVLNDVWILDLSEMRWRELFPTGSSPPGVFGHTAELIDRDPTALTMVTYGGQTAGGLLTGELHLLQDVYGQQGTPVWRRVAAADGSVPPAVSRWGHSMTVLWENAGEQSAVTGEEVPDGGAAHLLVCGGMGEAFRSLDDVISFDLREMRWRVLQSPTTDGECTDGSRPQGRRRHISALAPDGRMVVFGGRSGWNSFHSDLWAFDIRCRAWSKIRQPEGVPWPLPRTGHCGALVGDSIYVFGGFELRKGGGDEWEYVLYEDLWSYSLRAGSWEQLTPDDADADLVTLGGAYGGSQRDATRTTRRGSNLRMREEGVKPDAGLPCLSEAAAALSPARCRRRVDLPDPACEELQEVPVHTCRDRCGVCRAPRMRSMAAAFVHNRRLYIHGGRDKNLAFDCFFSLPLDGGARDTLVELAAQLVADTGLRYWDMDVPGELSSFVDTLFQQGRGSRRPSLRKPAVVGPVG